MLYVIGVFISLFLALLIFTKKGRTLADIVLGIWMLVVGFHLFSYYLYISNQLFSYPFLLGSNLPIPFFHGPLLYLYTLALTQPERFKQKTWLLHFLLPLVMILLYTPFYLLSYEQKIYVYQHNGKGYETLMFWSGWLLNISGVVYVIINFWLLQRHQKRILGQFSNQEKINLHWLRFLFYMMAVMWVFIIWIQNDTLIFSASSVFVVLIGYFGIKQVGIFTNHRPALSPMLLEPALEMAEDEEPNKKKYAKSGLSEEAAKDLHTRLAALMQFERLFTEPDLTLTDLATRLDTHPNYLSQVINETEGVNFYDYINTLRVEEFKRLVVLPENQRFTLLALAYDCGFNSKSAFNRFFKKATNVSPSEYAKRVVSGVANT
jgi:AraC-like DNA-binding protein